MALQQIPESILLCVCNEMIASDTAWMERGASHQGARACLLYEMSVDAYLTLAIFLVQRGVHSQLCPPSHK